MIKELNDMQKNFAGTSTSPKIGGALFVLISIHIRCVSREGSCKTTQIRKLVRVFTIHLSKGTPFHMGHRAGVSFDEVESYTTAKQSKVLTEIRSATRCKVAEFREKQ